MIFVTVGSSLSFERFIDAVDTWAGRHPDVGFFAQVGNTVRPPRHMAWATTIDAEAFDSSCQLATVVVAHAGMGTILTALQAGKPVIIFARRGDLAETRNDHQVATLEHLSSRKGIHPAHTAVDLQALLDRRDDLEAPDPIGASASPQLIAGLRDFLAAE